MYIRTELANAVASYLKVEIDVLLGSGYFGKAYKLKDGRVLKITSDVEEYSTAILLKEKSFRHIVKIFDAFKFQVESTDFYVVIRDYLEVSAPLERFEMLTSFGDKMRWLYSGAEDLQDVREETAECKEGFPDIADLIDQYWQVFEDCKRAGFEKLDIKAANLGLKGDVLQLLDTGWSGNNLEKYPESIKISYNI